MRITPLAAFALVFAAVSTPAQLPSTVDARLIAQNTLFDLAWQQQLQLNPLQATAVGDYRYNDQLGDFSLAGTTMRHNLDVTNLSRIKGISDAGFSEQDIISHDLFVRQLQERVEDY